jgi:hypothetical protein
MQFKIDEHHYRIREVYARMKVRRQFLTERAADIICAKNGIKTIPGFHDRRATASNRRRLQKEKLKALREAANMVLPKELADEIEKPDTPTS